MIWPRLIDGSGRQLTGPRTIKKGDFDLTPMDFTCGAAAPFEMSLRDAVFLSSTSIAKLLSDPVSPTAIKVDSLAVRIDYRLRDGSPHSTLADVTCVERNAEIGRQR